MLYAQGTVTGRGFVTHADREEDGLELRVWGNIMVVPDGYEWWLTRNSLTAISKAAAQSLYDTHVDTAIAGFDPDDNFEGRPEPTRGTLP